MIIIIFLIQILITIGIFILGNKIARYMNE